MSQPVYVCRQAGGWEGGGGGRGQAGRHVCVYMRLFYQHFYNLAN